MGLKDEFSPELERELKVWQDNAAFREPVNWEAQLATISRFADMISPELPVEKVIAAIYSIVNQLMDAYQFSVGLYDAREGILLYKGSIENGKPLADISIHLLENGRLTNWCIIHEQEIFINDMDAEYSRYVSSIPEPHAGLSPKAALYVPLKLHDEVKAVITVRTPRKNVYSRHHLYILKTLGDLVLRSIALSEEKAKPFVKSAGGSKKWRWNEVDALQPLSRKLLQQLTPREKEVLFLLICGCSIKEIAAQLYLSPGTVKTHTLNLYQKLGVGNRTSAIMRAIELAWLI